MDDTSIDELRTRLCRLERSLRRRDTLAFALVGFLIVSAAAGFAPSDHAKTVRAGKIALVDADGNERIVFSTVDGEPSMSLTDTSGRQVVELVVPKVPDKPALYLRDPGEAAMIELALTMNGPVLHFSDREGTRVRLATNELNAPLVAVYGGNRRELFTITEKAAVEKDATPAGK